MLTNLPARVTHPPSRGFPIIDDNLLIDPEVLSDTVEISTFFPASLMERSIRPVIMKSAIEPGATYHGHFFPTVEADTTSFEFLTSRENPEVFLFLNVGISRGFWFACDDFPILDVKLRQPHQIALRQLMHHCVLMFSEADSHLTH